MVTISQQISTQRVNLALVRSNTLKAQQQKDLKQRDFENFRKVNLPKFGSGFVRKSTQFRDFKFAEQRSRRANNALRNAKAQLRGLKRTQDVAQSKLITKQSRLAKKGFKTITVSVGGARNTIETRQVTRAGRTRTTFINRETGGQVSVGRKATFGSLSSTERKTLTRTTPVRKIKEKEVTVTSRTRLIRLRSIAEILPGVRLKGELLSSQEFSKRDLDIISKAANPAQAEKVVRELKKREEVAAKQKLQSFLKVTLAEVKTQKDVDNINKAIDTQIKRREDKGLQRDVAVSQVGKEFKAIISNFKKGKISLKGTKNFGVNVVLGFVGVFTAPIKASFNYGKNLVNRGLWNKRSDNPLLRDVKRAGIITGRGIFNVGKAAKFVVTNPRDAIIIIGVASAIAGTSLLGAFRKNPGRTLGEALAIIFPGIVIKAVGVTAKVSKVTGVKIIKATNPAAKAFNKKLKNALKNNRKVTAKIETQFMISSLVDNTKFPPALKQIYRQALQKKTIKELRVLTRSTRQALAAQKLIKPTTPITSVIIRKSVAQRLASRKKTVKKFKKIERKKQLKLLKVKLIDAKNKAALFFNKLVNKAIRNQDKIIEKEFHITSLVQTTKFPPALKQIYRQALQRKTLNELRVLTRSTRQALALQKRLNIIDPSQVKLVKITVPRPGTKARKQFSKNVLEKIELEKTGKISKFKTLSKTKNIIIREAIKLKTILIVAKNKAALRFNKLVKQSFGRGDKIFEKQFHITSLVQATKFPPALKQIYRQALQKKSLKELRVLTRSTKQALALQKRITVIDPSKVRLVIKPRLGTEKLKFQKAIETANKKAFDEFKRDFPAAIGKGKTINVFKGTRNTLFKNKKARILTRQILVNKGDELLKESRQVNKIITIRRSDIIKATIRLKIGRQILRIDNLLKKAIAWERANGILRKLNVNVTSGQTNALRSLILQMKASKLLLRKDLIIVNKLGKIKDTPTANKLAQELSIQQLPIIKNIQNLKTPQDLKVIQAKITALAPAVLQKFKVPELLKLKTVQVKKAISKPKRIRIPNFNKLKRKGLRAGFIIRVKQGNVIISKTSSTLPEKRAINLMRTIVDNTVQASGEIVRKGKTSIVDVKKTILGNKFRPKRSQDPKVRIQVEKRKFRLDTKGEREGLRRSPRKRRKKSKQSKRLKRTKSRKRVSRKRGKKK